MKEKKTANKLLNRMQFTVYVFKMGQIEQNKRKKNNLNNFNCKL